MPSGFKEECKKDMKGLKGRVLELEGVVEHVQGLKEEIDDLEARAKEMVSR